MNLTSVAVVGASPREYSFGWKSCRGVGDIGYDGDVHLVNPRDDAIDDRLCSPDIAAIGTPVEYAMLNVANARLEGVLDDAIANRMKAVTIFASCYLKGDTDPLLLDRLQTKVRAAGLQVCGGNGSGFVNRDEKRPRSPWSAHATASTPATSR
ncbi:MAG: CoA-binding protein [Rhodospirillales bacterium]|nr:CoA-binding protein [Rhodospirillales bacterium]